MEQPGSDDPEPEPGSSEFLRKEREENEVVFKEMEQQLEQINALSFSPDMHKLELDRLKGNVEGAAKSHIDPKEKSQLALQRVQGQIRSLRNRVDKVPDTVPGAGMSEVELKKIADQLADRMGAPPLRGVNAIQPSDDRRKRNWEPRFCQFCKSETHNTEFCWADPRSAHYGEGWTRNREERDRKKKEIANSLQKRKSRGRCKTDSDDDRSRRDPSEEDERERKKFNAERQKLALDAFSANLLQAVDRNLFQSTAVEEKKASGVPESKNQVATLCAQVDTESDSSDPSETLFGWLENENEDYLAQQCNALKASPLIPPIQCLPRHGAKLERPRRHDLPKISPGVTDAEQAWEELRIMGQGETDNMTEGDSDDNLCDTPLMVLNLERDCLPQAADLIQFDVELSAPVCDIDGEGAHTAAPPLAVNQIQAAYPCSEAEGADDEIGLKCFEISETKIPRSEDLRAEASRLCDESSYRLRAEFAGLYGEEPNLADDPANADINYFEEVFPRPPRNLDAIPFLDEIPDDFRVHRRDEDLPAVFGMLDGEPVDIMADSGANVSVISENLYNRVARANDSTLEIIPQQDVVLHAVGRVVQAKAKCKVTLSYGKRTTLRVHFSSFATRRTMSFSAKPP